MAALAQIDQAPGGGVREDLVLRVPLERDRNAAGLVPALAQPQNQFAHVRLGPAFDEGHLRLAHGNGSNGHLAAEERHARGVRG